MFNLASFLSQFTIPPIGINFLDIIIIFIILFYAHEGYSLGFTLAFFDLASFVVSFIIALKFYGFVAQILIATFSMPIGFANAAGFFLTAVVTEVLLRVILRKGISRIPRIPISVVLYKFFKKIDHWLGLIPGSISAFIVLSFILSLIVSLPASPLVNRLVNGSKIGSRLLSNTSFFEKRLNDVFGGAISETLNFLTVEPQSDKSVTLNFKVQDGTIDQQAEQEMHAKVNAERVKAGVGILEFDDSLRDVGREHSRDMFERGYFSHNSPEGITPFDRMDKAQIRYSFAGENLALAPSTNLAMQGLMASPGHRKNILSPNFKKIGIGVIDGGIYGKMYSQEFSD